MLHTLKELAEFTDGETRFVYARDRDTGALVLLEDGTARDKRAYTKAQLRCIIHDCGTPALTTVSRSRGRDGYRHLKIDGTLHALESVFHLQGKFRVRDWLRTNHPRSATVIEQASSDTRERIADVMMTAKTMERAAFEIQYATLSIDAWRRRHESYRDQGILDIWLLGHAGAQLNVNKHNQVRLSDLHQAMLTDGHRLLWLNPIRSTVATAVVRRDSHTDAGMLLVPAGPEDRIVSLKIFPLESCHVGSHGILATELGELDRNWIVWQKGHAAWEKERLAEEAEERRQRQEGYAREQRRERLRRLAAEAASATDERKRARAAAVSGFEITPEFKLTIVAEHRGVWPTYLSVDTGPGIPVEDRDWQLWAWERLRSDGVLVATQLVDRLEFVGATRQAALTAVNIWLEYLASLAMVHWGGRAVRLLEARVEPQRPKEAPRHSSRYEPGH